MRIRSPRPSVSCPDFRNYVIGTDVFTPKTIRRFTWHDNGAVYGAPDKRFDGATPFAESIPVRD